MVFCRQLVYCMCFKLHAYTSPPFGNLTSFYNLSPNPNLREILTSSIGIVESDFLLLYPRIWETDNFIQIEQIYI
jgi:hypothetical protein